MGSLYPAGTVLGQSIIEGTGSYNENSNAEAYLPCSLLAVAVDGDARAPNRDLGSHASQLSASCKVSDNLPYG